MPDIKRILRNIKSGLTPEQEDTDPIRADATDRVTTDKYLRSLRRQYRVEQETNEKDALKMELARIEKEKERKYLWGFVNEPSHSKPPRKKRVPPRQASFLSRSSLR